MRLEEIADLLADFRHTRERLKLIKEDMARVAVEHLGLPQDEVTKRIDRLDALLDGYLLGQGMRQSWRYEGETRVKRSE